MGSNTLHDMVGAGMLLHALGNALGNNSSHLWSPAKCAIPPAAGADVATTCVRWGDNLPHMSCNIST
jgi:hypothetical protein